MEDFPEAPGITFQTEVPLYNFSFIYKCKTIKRNKNNCGRISRSINRTIEWRKKWAFYSINV